MPDAFRAEFTGERVIPGLVEDNLFAEHLARYRFAKRLAPPGGRALDAGCGAGYGAVELSESREVLAIDVSEDAIAHARSNYGANRNVRFEIASCTAIPEDAGTFQLITAFELIEHLDNWRDFLREMSRVLGDGGMFLVSTPNRLYYAESRKKAGPNPFHNHEFTREEFQVELEQVFPHVKMMSQNHVEGIAFAGGDTSTPGLEIADRKGDAEAAHFFLAICGKQPLPSVADFVFLPESGNVLQTRERHIELLEGEIAKKNEWIAKEQADRQRMLKKVAEMELEVEDHNKWAQKANAEADRRGQLVADLQKQLETSNAWAKARDEEAKERGARIVQLQNEVATATSWAKDREAEAVERGERVIALQNEVAIATTWAKDREAEAVERGERVVALQVEVARATEWAKARDTEAEERGARVVELQQEIESVHAGYQTAIADWQKQKEASDQWARDNDRRLNEEREVFTATRLELEAALEKLAALEAETTALHSRLDEATQRLDMVAQSRWVKLGRKIKIGPEIERN